jgi:ubiquinone/menaquinone biosynthesis C-methylase UbiE
MIADAFAERAARSWRVAQTIYSAEELASLPPSVVESALGLGHPVRDAELREGEVVLDIGCGTGIDLLLAASAVGDTGKVIGLDLTPEMVDLARAHVATQGLTNVELLLAPMEAIPLPDASVDVIISNGVFNLSHDKDRAFAEAQRVLQPGGRMVVSDMLLVADLPHAVLESPKLWSG